MDIVEAAASRERQAASQGRGWLRCIALVVAMAMQACSEPDAGDPSPTLTLIDSVTLQEPDGAVLGQPGGVAVLSDGSLLISDVHGFNVLRFARDGSHLGAIGRRGPGPDEIDSTPADVAVDGDTIAFVRIGNIVKAFLIADGSGSWQHALHSTAFPPSAPLAPRNGGFIYGSVDRGRRTSLARVESPRDEPMRGGPFPAPLGSSRVVDDAFAVTAAAWLAPDTVAVMIEASPFLFIGPWMGPFDSVLVGKRSRNGHRPELVASVRDGAPQTASTAEYALSVPTAIGPLDDGGIAIVTTDIMPMERGLGARLFVSVVDVDRRATCADAVVPVPEAPRPVVAIHGDTLITVSQVHDGDTELRAVVTRYRVDVQGCQWLTAP